MSEVFRPSLSLMHLTEPEGSDTKTFSELARQAVERTFFTLQTAFSIVTRAW